MSSQGFGSASAIGMVSPPASAAPREMDSCATAKVGRHSAAYAPIRNGFRVAFGHAFALALQLRPKESTAIMSANTPVKR